MLVVDQLKKNDPQLRFVAVAVFTGMIILFCGLWWVQLISTRHFQEKLEIQSIRTVRIPAQRGKILDHEGRALAESRPSYNVDLYLEALSKNFQDAYAGSLRIVQTNLPLQLVAKEKELRRTLTPVERKQFTISQGMKDELKRESRYTVVSNLMAGLSANLRESVMLPEKEFRTKYDKARALPIPILDDGLNPAQLALFEEHYAAEPGMDLAVESLRYYPYGTLAAHLLGYLSHRDETNSTHKFSYRMVDYEGTAGIEHLFDGELHGTPGEKSIVVNHDGYRQPQSDTVWSDAEPGRNVVLTIDLDIQKAAEKALAEAQANVRGAVVVMNAQNGDVLAMCSAPNYDPNHFIHHPADPAIRQKEEERWDDPLLLPQHNRAIYENYHPGSIFKIVVAMAALEQNELDPHEIFQSLGYYMVGRRKIGDTAGAGPFDFNRAMAKSSNPYFIEHGLKPGVLPRIIALGQRLHLGERTGIIPHQETAGNFPTLKHISSEWRDGDTANLSIGQGDIDVTPVQMAVMTAAVANGGTVFWPRVVARTEDSDGGNAQEVYPPGRVRDNLGVSQHTLQVLYQGMLADTEDPDGTGHLLKVPGWRVAGKTGTAQVERNGRVERSAQDTWFASFAPFSATEKPRYVVVAMVEGGASGGLTCVPIADKIYHVLQANDQRLQSGGKTRKGTLAAVQ